MRRFSVAAAVLAGVAIVATACGDDDGDSKEAIESDVAGQRLQGCLAEAGFDFERFFDGELGAALQDLFDEHTEAEDLPDVDEFFSDLDQALSDDFSEYGLSDEFSDEVSDLSADYSEFNDEGFSDEADIVSFVECLGFTEEEFDEFIDELTEDFSSEFSDDFTDGGTTDEFSDDFS